MPGDNPHRHDFESERLVELVAYVTRRDADAVVAFLKSEGVEACARHSSGGPSLYGTPPHRVLVYETDLARATEALRDVDAADRPGF